MTRPVFNPGRDVLSGIIMAATNIPQLIAYAETVGYASYRGLTNAGPPLLVWGLISGHPYLNAGVTSITALMTKSDLQGAYYVAQYGEAAYVQLVACYSFCVGFASIVLVLVGFGQLAQRVPWPVRSGFKWGCSVGVLAAAIPNGLFHQGGPELQTAFGRTSWSRHVVSYCAASCPGLVHLASIAYGLSHPELWSIPSTTLFVVGTLFVMHGQAYLPKVLPPGTDVVLLTAVATAYSMLTSFDGAVVGHIPQLDDQAGIAIAGGWLHIPVQLYDLRHLLQTVDVTEPFGGSYVRLAGAATLLAAVNFLSIMGIATGFETDQGIAWSPHRELLAQGVGCVAAALVGSAPVSGSLSRSLVARMTGATSQLACIVTALCWIYLQPYMTIMSPTPKAALSAVIVSAVVTGVGRPRDLCRLRGVDAVVGWMTGVITALTSPTQGFGAGLVIYGTLHQLTHLAAWSRDRKRKKQA